MEMNDPVLFGKYIGEVVEVLKTYLINNRIPQWLARSMPGLGGQTPLEHIWENGERGKNNVIELIQKAMRYQG